MDTDALVRMLYSELRSMARHQRFRAGPSLTLQTTAVLHEAYLKLADTGAWQSRDHFLAVACTTMRHVLIDAARARLADKRSADHSISISAISDRQLDSLGEALDALARHDADLARLVDCRFFGGLNEQEAAQAMGVSDRTVRRRWQHARAWIHGAMTEG